MKLHIKKIGIGPPVIILHGFLGTSDNWITIAKRLADRYSVYLVDQRNHGRSPHSLEHSLELMASDLHELIQNENIKSPVLVGHSMGGKVVIQYVKEYGDDFSSLIVVDVAPKTYPPHHQEIFDGLFSIDLQRVASRHEADVLLEQRIKDTGVRQFLLKNLSRTREGFVWKANLNVLVKVQNEVGKGIDGNNLSDKPVFFIRGDQSDYILREDRPHIKELFPNAIILTIRQAGHWVHADQPEAFYKTLNSILENY